MKGGVDMENVLGFRHIPNTPKWVFPLWGLKCYNVLNLWDESVGMKKIQIWTSSQI